MVSLENITVSKRGQPLLGPVSAQFADHGVTAIVGPNGSGKSTLLRLLHGLERPRGGKIIWSAPFPHAEQSFVFQTPVFLRRTVRENLELPTKLRGQTLDLTEIAAEFEITKELDRAAQDLSGGEKQRLAMARALSIEPKLLFLDEPTANLDHPSTTMIENAIIAHLNPGMRTFIASHSRAQVRRIANDVLYLDAGQSFGPFPTQEFFDSPPEVARTWVKGLE